MNKKSKQLLVAIVAFGIAAFVSYSYVQGIRQDLAPGEFVYVAQATQGLSAGQKLMGPMVTPREMPKNFVPKAAIQGKNKQQAQEQIQQYMGQDINVNVESGDYLMTSYFGEREVAAGKLSGQIAEKGFRAVNLPVDETNSMARSIVAEDHVDILLTFQVAGIPQKFSTVLLQNVRVLSTGTYSASDREMGGDTDRVRRYNSLTLLLHYKDAIRLLYARQAGQIQIMLRQEADSDQANYGIITGVQDILPADEKDKIQGAMEKSSAVFGGGSPDGKITEQLKQALEAQRRQSQSSGK